MSFVQQLEKQLKDSKELVAKRDIILRLYENHDFRKVILEDYATKHVADLVELSADPRMDAVQRADSLAMAQAAGHLKRHIQAQIMMANKAEENIPSIEAELEAARSEESE